MSNADGLPVVAYVPREHDGKPWADRVEAVGPDAADFIIREMSGWTVSCAESLSVELIARGARRTRHSHRMTRDLSVLPPPAEWARLSPPAPLRLRPVDRPAADLLPAWRAAYPDGHPDHFPLDDETAVCRRLGPLVAGTLYGPLVEISALIVSATDTVVACVLVNLLAGVAPLGGPWITELFRDPAPGYGGLGTLLLRRALARAHAAGLPAMSLAVTDKNPAVRLYERYGFATVDSPVSVVIDGRLSDV